MAIRKLLTSVAAAAALASTPAQADWRDQFDVIKFGILSGENERDRIQRYTPFQEYLTEALGVPVEIFTASSYAGVMQAHAAKQIQFAFYGSSSYAGIWKETGGQVEPLLTRVLSNGSTGYYSVVVTRCDSGNKNLDDLKGKVLAFADPNSTSGYQVPYTALAKQGYNPETFFSATPFSGAHETGVLGVANGQYDAAATNIKSESDGHPQNLERKGMIEPGVICIIWKSKEITSGPLTAHKDLPADLVADFERAIYRAPADAPEAFEAMATEKQIGFLPVDHERYAWVIDMQEDMRELRRKRAAR